MAGGASGAGGGRYNLRPRGPRLRGAAALANSPLLGRLLEELSAVFDAEVMPRLDPAARALFGRAGNACRDAVLRCPALPCAGRTAGVRLEVDSFIASVQLLAWARANGCPWSNSLARAALRNPCALAAFGGHLVVLRWARERHWCPCPWDESTCAAAAAGGHLDAVLQWVRDHGCPWNQNIAPAQLRPGSWMR
jgi:hypothetical protein